ncbi:RHS repeat protein [Paraburkholderia phenoliruptrix]|nr:RHS repeat protein [Paraburkholderia phenoliruptrix]MBW9133359.1 RHS repeat protein [Paraburkholderia ginsengiterrae]
MDSGFGSLWVHNWQRQLNLTNVNSATPKVTAYRGDANPLIFNKVSSGWRSADGTPLLLTQNSSSWTLDDLTNGARELYSAQGVLLSVTEHDGRTSTLTYSDANTPASIAPAAGLLIAITDHAPGSNPYYDLSIRLTYDAKWRITQFTDSNENVTQYGYDGYNNLISVSWPDGTTRHYAYEDARFTSALTGVTDETGTRVGTWTYDSMGRATAVTHPNAQQNVAFSYAPNVSTITTSQRATTFNFATIGGMLRTTGNDAGYSMGWDAGGKLTSDVTPYGKNVQYKYDTNNRPIQSISTSISGATSITSVSYADSVRLRPYMVATPGWLRTYVYDANGNLTGLSERRTTDATGADGFSATLADAPTRAYGMVYDASNHLIFAQRYDNDQRTGEWGITQDAAGNLHSITDRISGNALTIKLRDTAHRIIQFSSPGFVANPYYDSRGRLIGFNYYEDASPSNGNVQRALKISYNYAADGTLTGRTGTVSTNLGPDLSISDDEIDKWLDNMESGVFPAGPSPTLLGVIKSLGYEQEVGLQPVCPECIMYAGARFAWEIFQLARDPMWVSKNGIQQATETKQCKPAGATEAGAIVFKRDHYINRAVKDGLNLDHAEAQVADEINAMRSDMLPDTNTIRQITVDGLPVEFRAYLRADGQVSVGTIFVVK